MITTLRAAAVALLVTAAIGTAPAQTPATIKLAYVNTETLMAAAPGRVAAQAAYDKELAVFTAQQKKWSDSLVTLDQNYTKIEPTLSATAKKASQDKFTAIQTEFQQKNLDGQQRMQTKQNELLAPMMEAVKKAIDDIRVEDGITIIFSGDANSPIVSADKNLDITDRVLSRMKTMATKAPATPSSMAPAAVGKKPPPR